MRPTLAFLLFSCSSPEPVPVDTSTPTGADGSTGDDTGVGTDDGTGDDTGSDGGTTPTDADEDGYIALADGGDDCDDTDATIHPGAEDAWYDGVDSNCDGADDYDADGDGHQAEAYGGDDCDDADAAVVTDCTTEGSPLDCYEAKTDPGEVSDITNNLSGITWNADSGTYFTIRDSSKRINELDTDMSSIREISITNVPSSDLEDIVWLGTEDGVAMFALVSEEGTLSVGPIALDDSSIRLDQWQTLTYGPSPDVFNNGAEGVAWDPASGTFWVCNEKSPMAISQFSRPSDTDDHDYTGDLVVTEPFDAEAALGDSITDISSCMFDPDTGRLLVLSHEAAAVLDVDLDGTILGELEVRIIPSGTNKPEGITLNDDDELMVAGEPNNYRIYACP